MQPNKEKQTREEKEKAIGEAVIAKMREAVNWESGLKYMDEARVVSVTYLMEDLGYVDVRFGKSMARTVMHAILDMPGVFFIYGDKDGLRVSYIHDERRVDEDEERGA